MGRSHSEPGKYAGFVPPSQDLFEHIWQNIILPEVGTYYMLCEEDGELYKKFPGLRLYEIPHMKEEIWESYCIFNLKYKTDYMMSDSPDGAARIDRHKIAAAYMAAIVMTQPLRLWEEAPQEAGSHFNASSSDIMVNEFLAITVGFSILTSICQEEEMISQQEKDALKKGILIPDNGDDVSHGDTYLSALAKELYFSRQDGNLNVLSLSNQLYLLEAYTRDCAGL